MPENSCSHPVEQLAILDENGFLQCALCKEILPIGCGEVKREGGTIKYDAPHNGKRPTHWQDPKDGL